ncbi:putative nucleoside-diphosphate-sugar epimerase [Microdochium bolleyi]|uniref:Putative nucleoside-diphosphate-sugar epimerase n=1 Tax=Microdochium bolleyi TaxID=196109 RepID=A0A136IYR5_9PEZI|nr:putative nucleoside-diphosphate-sugar epimerase [Microdochium bolleyi]
MKIIVSGATGFVGREAVRQSLAHPSITTVVALARKPVSFTEAELLPGSDASKLVNATIADYGEYPPDVTAKFAGANACIWTVGMSPFKASTFAFPEVQRVCQTCTIQGYTAMLDAGVAGPSASQPFRFVYTSGMGVEPDQTKKPFWSPKFMLMRGETENQVLALAAKHPSGTAAEAIACRFGMISSPGLMGSVMGGMSKAATGWPTLTNVEAARVLIDQAVGGFFEGRTTLDAGDLARALKSSKAKGEGAKA